MRIVDKYLLFSNRDASYPILPYLSRPSALVINQFSPASTIFAQSSDSPLADDESPVTILELGSGQSMATLHLLNQFAGGRDQPPPADRQSLPKVFLSDLPDVIPLCRRNAQKWRDQHESQAGVAQVEVDVVPLAWGDLEMGDQLARQLASEKRSLTHVLLIDLV